MNTRKIGAPNSIARYLSEAKSNFGNNEWAVFEYEQGAPVMRAAGSKAHCERYMSEGRHLIDLRPWKAHCEDCGEILSECELRPGVFYTCPCHAVACLGGQSC